MAAHLPRVPFVAPRQLNYVMGKRALLPLLRSPTSKKETPYLEGAQNNNYAANVFVVIFLSVPYLYVFFLVFVGLFFLLGYGLFGSNFRNKCKTTHFFF